MFIKIYDNNPDIKAVTLVAEQLNRGAVVILPTDTIYTIACKMGNKKGIETLCRIKDLAPKNADFSVLCSSLSEMSLYTKPMNNQLFRTLKNNLPGPFTFIVEANAKVPKLFGNKRKTIGIRVPDNSIFQAIAKEVGEPLIGTSIHDDDEVIEYTTDPELIYEKYDRLVDLMVDGGYGNNVASTVVDCMETPPVVIRQGMGELID